MVTRKKIVEYLDELEILEDTDMTLVDELVYNTSLMRSAKKEVKDKGITVYINAGKTLTINPAISVYNSALKQVLSISRSLGLSPAARKELGIGEVKLNDGFDKE